MDDRRGVVVIGDALIDEIHGDGTNEEFVGGAALNVAVGLAVLGVEATLIAMVGDDAAGTRIRSFLRAHGVDFIPTIGPNGTSRGVSVRIDGEASYTFNTAAQRRRIEFGAAERAAIEAADLVVVSCFPFDDLAQSNELVAAVREPERRLIVDPNPRDGMMHDPDAFRRTVDEVARTALLIKVGDDDSALLRNSPIEEFSTGAVAAGARIVLATMGRDGAFVETAGGRGCRVPVARLPGAIVDTMGAGDATLASVVQSFLVDGVPAEDRQWRSVLERAMLIAAATCRHRGALLRQPPA